MFSINSMHFRLKRNFWLRDLAIWAVLICLSSLNAPALSTGIPLRFTIDPATLRQREKDETPVLATVTLKVPAPVVFVCQIRSSDKGKVSFNDIVFKKGQIEGTAPGMVSWTRILQDCAVKVSAFSVDAPGEKLWFTVTLKVKDQTPPTSDDQS